MTSSIAEVVLNNKTLRWSHPDKFDDTLDVAQTLPGKMDESKQKQIQNKIIDFAVESSDNLSVTPPNEIFKKLVLLFQSIQNKTSLDTPNPVLP